MSFNKYNPRQPGSYRRGAHHQTSPGNFQPSPVSHSVSLLGACPPGNSLYLGAGAEPYSSWYNSGDSFQSWPAAASNAGPKRFARGSGPSGSGTRFPLGQGMGRRPPWGTAPTASSATERRRKSNFELRKIILPKAPVTVLNEMLANTGNPVEYSFLEPYYNGVSYVFYAECEVEGEKFSGVGPTKQISKSVCAEAAIQAIVSKRCLETSKKMQQNPRNTDDDTPWAQLASLGLYKLFNDWTAQGFNVPKELSKPPDAAPEPVIHATGPLDLPENQLNQHPVQVLNQLKSGLDYKVISESNNKLRPSFTMEVSIDGNTFQGTGRTKKDAKKNCAIQALKDAFGITYSMSSDPTEGGTRSSDLPEEETEVA